VQCDTGPSENLVADIDTLVAYIDIWAGNEFLDLALPFPTEGAPEFIFYSSRSYPPFAGASDITPGSAGARDGAGMTDERVLRALRCNR
jgi:hypothetical protein